MKAAIVVLLCVPAFVLLAGCATKQDPPGACIPPDVLERCGRQGGCTLFSRDRLAELLEHVAAQSCQGRM